ncbi:hypothetical protein [Streptosporangium longisporum]|uniref:hypothetical protein n=1 Tax=Streptosporangium longisporum TaxID=46187 RepID=UPI0031EED435
MDGGVRSASNVTNLAAGSSVRLIMEPLAHVSPRARFEAEVAELGDARIAHVGPHEAAITVFGSRRPRPGPVAPGLRRPGSPRRPASPGAWTRSGRLRTA